METILILGVKAEAARGIATALADKYRILPCECCREVADTAKRQRPAAIVVHWEAFERESRDQVAKIVSSEIPLIALAPMEQSAEATKRGAVEVLPAEATIRELRDALARVLLLRTTERLATTPFIGSSPALLEAAEQIRLYATCDHPVLILGESGTGKELAARALHEISRRRSGPFIGRNCAALPDLLAESELFGTERGAFTDAIDRVGVFELARGGALFLDEIGDMSLAVQAKLLRALETGEIWPLGARKSRHSDLRFISATNRDIEAAVASGQYRADLFYRIETLVLRLPPLRECREDIPDIAAHFLNEASAGKTVIGRGALRRLVEFDWPGNVRQLRSVVLRAFVHARGAIEIKEEHIIF
ncbi:MAG TPA: sigma-54 dependent transcriptional regulator [Rectinemataceae bacterium]|nr:sigma-54 dependent transcriptional regulator [Rectinemataceae bacterium]